MPTLPVTEALIRQHSTAESFARGQAYYHEGAVEAMVQRGNMVQAEVAGSEPDPYSVTLVLDERGEVRARCTCPYDWGGWCKHIVATLLAILHHPAAIEKRSPLPDLLAPLDRDTLHALLLRLAESDPSLVECVEAQIGLMRSTSSARGDPPTGELPTGGPQAPEVAATPAPAPVAPMPPVTVVTVVTVAAVRRELRSVLGGLGRGRGYDHYWSVGSILGGVDQVLERAWSLIQAGAGHTALPVLEVITEEVWSCYEELDDSDGEGVPLFEGIGAAWAEALLSRDVTSQERQSWGAKLKGWRDELADYGLEEGFDAAVQAATQGWDDPQLVRVLQGQDTRASLWDAADAESKQGGPPDWLDNEMLAQARLNVLERAGRWDEYLRFADAAGQVVAYTTMLVQLGRVREAIAYGLEHLATTDEALALAQVLGERQNPQGALEIAEHGLGLQGMKAALATWTAEVAAALGETTRALAAAEIAVRQAPTLERYRRVQELAGTAWSSHRDTLLDHLRSLPSLQGSYAYAAYAPGPVEIFLHEGLIEDAMAAVDRGASHTLLETVVDAARLSHPGWVITTSRREAEAIMDRGKSEYYSAAAHWLARVRDAYRVAGREADWQAYRAQLLSKHGRKYRLVPLLKAL